MKTVLTLRSGTLLVALFAVASLCPVASAQVDPCKGGDCTTSGGSDDPIFPGGGVGNNPPKTPEPFTMALGVGAVGLYARRRFVKSRQAASA